MNRAATNPDPDPGKVATSHPPRTGAAVTLHGVPARGERGGEDVVSYKAFRSWADGAAIGRVATKEKLVTTSGLGHGRILGEPEVVKQGVDFLAARYRKVANFPYQTAVPDNEEEGPDVLLKERVVT